MAGSSYHVSSVRSRSSLGAAVLALGLFAPVAAQAQAIAVESFSSQAEFQASALYAHIMGLLGGPANHGAVQVQILQQGSQHVEASSAGALSNTTIDLEVQNALLGAPTLLGGAADSADCHKEFLMIGNDPGTGPNPIIEFEMPPVETDTLGDYNGYDIAIFDIGSDLVSDAGRKNSERTTFEVNNSLLPQPPFTVGQITNTGGDFINVILLDLSGIAGIPPTIDRLTLIDAMGTNNPTREGLDIDGVLRLNFDPATQSTLETWGKVKSMYR